MKRYQITAAVFAGAAALAFSGCTKKETEMAAETIAETEAVSTTESTAGELSIYDDAQDTEAESSSAGETSEGESSETDLSFEDLKHIQFVFSSGAGGWSTLLDIRPDGSFEGEYFDSDMGSMGETYPNGTVYLCDFKGQFTEPEKIDALDIRPDGSFEGEYFDSDMGSMGETYPNGTVYLCDFKGQFTEPEKIDAYTYAVRIASMEYKNTAGTEEIKDGIRYCYSDVYGLDGADRILIHLPGTPLQSLPEELRGWIGYYDLSSSEETELSFYVLDNENQQYGFRGWDSFQGIKELIDNTAKQASKLEAELETDSSLTQADLNRKSQEVYELWDSALNQLWDVLKQSKDSKEMEMLTSEQRVWIQEKEAAAKDAGALYEGGSMQPMVISQKAAELTKERVYQLLEYLE